MAEVIEVSVEEAPEDEKPVVVEAPEKAKPKPKKQAKAGEDPPEEITIQTAHGPVTFAKKRAVGRPKKEAKPRPPKKVTLDAPPEPPLPEPPLPEPAEADKENEPPPQQPPLVRMSGRQKLEEHMRLMHNLRGDAKESQRTKYRAMLRA